MATQFSVRNNKRWKERFFPMIFLSGGTIPHEIMSDGVLAVARAIPLTHVVTLLKGMWLGWAGQTWLPSSIVLFAILIITGVGAIRWFKWDATSLGCAWYRGYRKYPCKIKKQSQVERSLG